MDEIPYIGPPPEEGEDGHLPSCGDGCRALDEMDPFLARVLEQYDELTEGSSSKEADRLMRNAWIDDDGTVHVRRLGAVPPPEVG